MQWLNETDLLVKDDEEPSRRVIFRQVGWLGQTGRFYTLEEDPSRTERGGFAPIYRQIEG